MSLKDQIIDLLIKANKPLDKREIARICDPIYTNVCKHQFNDAIKELINENKIKWKNIGRMQNTMAGEAWYELVK